MATKLPYFKFYSSEWNDGDITLLDMDTQGVFINVCSWYWSRECTITMDKLRRKFKAYDSAIEELISENLIINLNDGFAKIRFLDNQWSTNDRRSTTSRVNGSKGGRPKKPNKPNHNLTKPNIDKSKIREDKIIVDNIKENTKENWLAEANPIYLDFCERYFLMLQDNEKTTKSTKWKIKTWYDSVRLLIEIDGATMDDLNKACHFLTSHLLDTYCPQVWSVISLRKKWVHLKSYMDRNDPTTKAKNHNPFG